MLYALEYGLTCGIVDVCKKLFNKVFLQLLASADDRLCLIGTEKLVSGTYNDDVFAFGDSGVRKLLADIQIEEQNHAEMLYKYKTVNSMS